MCARAVIANNYCHQEIFTVVFYVSVQVLSICANLFPMYNSGRGFYIGLDQAIAIATTGVQQAEILVGPLHS